MPESIPDINPSVEKARKDVERFKKAKESILPHLTDFPDTEQRKKREFSKETLIADIFDRWLKPLGALINNPVLIEDAKKVLVADIDQGIFGISEPAGQAYQTYIFLLNTGLFTELSVADRENVVKQMQEVSLVKAGIHRLNHLISRPYYPLDIVNALRIYGAMKDGNALSDIPGTNIPDVKNFLHKHPSILEDMIAQLDDIESMVIKESKDHPDIFNMDIGSFINKKFILSYNGGERALFIFASLLESGVFYTLSHEMQKRFMRLIYKYPQLLMMHAVDSLTQSVRYGSDDMRAGHSSDAVQAVREYSTLITVQKYFRNVGRRIDDERFEKEALNPEKKIPPRPETKIF